MQNLESKYECSAREQIAGFLSLVKHNCKGKSKCNNKDKHKYNGKSKMDKGNLRNKNK